jgi:hypothetical protein
MSERFKAKYMHRLPWGAEIALTCHFKFEKATDEQKFDKAIGGGKSICNGCGPSGFGALVPDSILGVCVTICGHIHNWAYQFGVDREDKMVADETFGDNMDRLIRAYYEFDLASEFERHVAARPSNFITRAFEAHRHRRRLDYLKERYETQLGIAEHAYEAAVRVFGRSAFWDKRKIGFDLEAVGPTKQRACCTSCKYSSNTRYRQEGYADKWQCMYLGVLIGINEFEQAQHCESFNPKAG